MFRVLKPFDWANRSKCQLLNLLTGGQFTLKTDSCDKLKIVSHVYCSWVFFSNFEMPVILIIAYYSRLQAINDSAGINDRAYSQLFQFVYRNLSNVTELSGS